MSLTENMELFSKFNGLSEQDKNMVFMELVFNLKKENHPLAGELDQIIEMIKLKQK
ncbi:hypothetical protein [Bacillus wiedmannii]|uniref:hypothetical protein n=1 Tax=Bacillus wiedmannii TaxID=1890302 RepID=UPI0015D4755C|nr:hypothetical protein [Bacillus wiedmannii]